MKKITFFFILKRNETNKLATCFAVRLLGPISGTQRKLLIIEDPKAELLNSSSPSD